jgi:hypothetical protein
MGAEVVVSILFFLVFLLMVRKEAIMNYWLKITMCISTLLLGSTQSGLGAEEMNKFVQLAALDTEDGPPPCGADNICNIAACSNDPDCPELPSTMALKISRYTMSTLSSTTADAILAKMTDILQTNNGSGDVACDVEFIRDGGVTVFSTGDGSIDSQAEFNTIIGLTGYVKVVNQINWCSGIGFNIIGCAPTPGSSLAVVRFTTIHQEGILWAHEYGHTQGLQHRSGDVVMNGTIDANNTRVNSTECNAYHN